MNAILSQINYPEDLKKLSLNQLPQLAAEMRKFIIDVVATKEGHLGASLGVVELTIALHYVFNTPNDKLIWDVGHQAYGHKILTGRKDAFFTNRQLNGISGFPKIDESEYDAFGVGHSSTSISAILGMALAAQLKGETDRKHIAVIGDASIAAGMAFEGLNHAGDTNANVLIILNDNAIGIDPSVGALKSYLTEVKEGRNPKANNMIQALNFDYSGPIDGHDLPLVIAELKRLKKKTGPQFLHIVTTKGKGLKQAEENQIVYHAPGKFNKETGDLFPKIEENLPPKFQDVFGLTLLELARQNDKIVGITPAMPTGSSLKYMMEVFPERAIDVGIAEQHAVTLAAGMALDGLTVFCTIYSTFLQRAYDQIIHDVALQNIPVVFCVDRAGLVGEDGATHQGVFDIAFLNAIPNIRILSPKDAIELRNTLFTLQLKNTVPTFVRYPKGRSNQINWQLPFEKIDFNHVEKIKNGNEIAILTTGVICETVLNSIQKLANKDLFSLFHFIQIKPINKDFISEIIKNHKEIIIVEEGSIIGGFGSVVSQFIAKYHSNVKVTCFGIPDVFVEHGTVLEQMEICGISENKLIKFLSKY
ncbi:1-deoxy-D-xylulose-5-phosphate synthase [Flavobacterium sp. I3-2]|uniref:1-deoxy-D-xylulose-5-phosphate synthase n=1 Tax=Flavobacterium sp. I3-2 TaxID=2748319 RepID=UPI0015A8CEBE|nr:1-deoxy-D-xylulose-5-phosphate synthase [Flavobacterium sp. I3-2]